MIFSVIKTIKCFLILLLYSITLLPPASAEQLQYSRVLSDEHYQFQYQWLDYQQKKQSLAFTLPADILYNSFRSFKAYRSSIASKVVMRNVQRILNQTPIEGVNVQFLTMGLAHNAHTNIKITGSDHITVKKAHAQVRILQQQEINRYYRKHYYQPFTDHHNNAAIKVDHGRVAQASVEAFKPISKEILEQVKVKDVRLVTNFILGFMQSIPYSTLESKASSSGAGFNPPMKLLYENQGDCDSKMALTVALLKATMPNINIIMVYIEEHVFIGINTNALAGDKTLEHNNRLYVLADPTGPSTMKLGGISPDAEMAINQSAYVVERYRN